MLTWSRNVSAEMYSIGSRCEWNWSTTVSGTFRRCSAEIIKLSWSWISLKHSTVRSPFQLTYDESHRYIVRKPDSITDADQFAAARDWRHAQRQRSTDAKSSTARCKPESHFGISTLSLFLYGQSDARNELISLVIEHASNVSINIVCMYSHNPTESRAAMQRSVCPDTIPWPDCTRSAGSPDAARSRSCRRRNDRTTYDRQSGTKTGITEERGNN